MSKRGPAVELRPAAPVLEGFVVQTAKPGQRRKAREAVTRVLGREWKVAEFGDAGTDFEVTLASGQSSRLSSARAWEKTYRLRAEPGILYAEPTFAVPVSGPPDFRPVEGDGEPRTRGVRSAATRDSAADSGDLPESEDPAWSIAEVKVKEAWALFPAGIEPGANVVVGHPDTGYVDHPENVTRLLKNKGHDFVKGDSDARDELDTGPGLFPGHGSSTSSVIVSPRGPQADFGTIKGKAIAVWGVAPGARLIPFRVSRSVVLNVPWAGGGPSNLAQAIELAADRGAHVVSISMGTGFPSSRLLKAVRYAQRQGVIILAAAGNYIPYVVWPAAYDEVIAVAASNARRKTWRHSSNGSAVDVTAPGESVWCAGVKDGKPVVGRGSGTSYAVATVAGVAALWLSHHGREKLVRRYGAEKIPVIFNQLLRDTCDPVPGWGSDFGRGLVNASRLLSAELPSTRDALPNTRALLREHPSIDSGGLATFRHLFETALPRRRAARATAARAAVEDELTVRLASLLGVSEEELPARLNEVGQELAFHFASDPELFRQFAEGETGTRPRAATRGVRAATRSAEGGGQIRAALLAKGTSAALKKRLAGGS
ncbi:MAG TPA: S8 family serine peptidase [Pyrinomonadaceae bacterium]|nr:S8 family serine peptidase [Pyrinomonadaceae bacterium]